MVENEARARRNQERQVRREAGEEDVEEDEPLLELVPNATVDVPVIVGDNTAADVIWAALKEDGEVRAKALEAITAVFGGGSGARDKEKSGKAVPTLLTEAPVEPGEEDGLQRSRLDQRLLNVIGLGFHLPLTLCTNEAIEAVHRKPSLLQCKSQHDASGTKISVVDVTAGWPDEHDMSSEDWRDAWTNFLSVLPEILAPSGVDRMHQHYNYLVRHPNFRICFLAILRFDIRIRHDYFWGRVYRARPLVLSASSAPKADTAPIGAPRPVSRTTPPSSPRQQRDVSYLRSQVMSSASPGTPAADLPARATDAPGAPEPTSALSVGPPVIMPVVSGASERDRIITTYRADALERELCRWGLWDLFSTVPTRLRFGFPIGNMPPLTRTFTPDNHKGGIQHMDFIKSYVNEQVALNHMSGPYSCEKVKQLLGSHFRTSPLSVVEKPNAPGKWRLIQNCSFRDEFGVSVNDLIDSDDFPTVWGTAAEVADIVANAPPGTQLATLDIDAAFRRIPIYPAHKAYLVIQCEDGQFYIDHVCPFGVSSGTGLQGAVMDPFVALLDARGWGPNRKWVDNLLNGRYPSGGSAEEGWTYTHSVNDIFRLAGVIGVPLHQDKWTPHASRAEYAGFLWNVDDKTVSLSEKKRSKYLHRVVEAIQVSRGGSARLDLKTVQKLNGTLSHCAFVYPQGRTFLSGLYAFAASFRNEFAPRYPPKSVISDLSWWRDLLSQPSAKRTLLPRMPLADMDLWVDASSSWGIGLVMGDTWDAWRWAVPYEIWHADARDIGWAEMVAIELALRSLDQNGLRNANVLLRSDNEGVVHAFKRGRSRNFQVNLSIRRTEALCMARNIVVQPVYVNTKINRADPVSRGSPGPGLVRAKAVFELSQELKPYLVHV
ncbi:hypothetical protein BN946_scf185010.g27 [Trametes cinnabarina]|uniref:Reverse transcriptase domain-containing protein n=1 Tax=Pycnoporus cinnabarinus TaxID=5643 RepID=A0A060SKQ6_PYCCI|nr:hypothetical protein BN946_scf185010.g27 [Trametes cinnabarina]